MNKGLSTAVTLFCVVVFIHGCNPSKNTVVQNQNQRNWLGADEAAMSSAQELDAPRILPRTYFAAALLFEQNGQWEKAVGLYRKAVAVNHQYVEAYAHMGMILGRLGRHTEAETALRRAVQLKPDSARMRNNLGYEYASQHRWDDALAELNNAIRLQPDFARAYVNLGMVLAKLQRFEEALESFNVALPKADAYYNLALMFRSDHRYRDSADALRHVLALNPTFPAAARQLEEIEQKIQPIITPDPIIMATVDLPQPEVFNADANDQEAAILEPNTQDIGMSLFETTLTSNQEPIADFSDSFVAQTVDMSMPTDEISTPDSDVHQPTTDPIVPQVVAQTGDDTTNPIAPTPIVQPMVDDEAVQLAVAEPTDDQPVEPTVVDVGDIPNDATLIVEAAEIWIHDPTFELHQGNPDIDRTQQVEGPPTNDVTMLVANDGSLSDIDPEPFVEEATADPIVEPAADNTVARHVNDATPIDEVAGPLFVEPTSVEVIPAQPVDIPSPVQRTESQQVLTDQSPIESFIDEELIDWILADAVADAPCPDEVADHDIIPAASPVGQVEPQPLVMDQPVGVPPWWDLCELAPNQVSATQPDTLTTTLSAKSPAEVSPMQIASPNPAPVIGPITEDAVEQMLAEDVFIWTISDATVDADAVVSGTMSPPTRDDGPLPFDFELPDVNLWHWAQQTAGWIERHQPVVEPTPNLPDHDPTDTLAGIDMPAETYINWPTAIVPQDDNFDSWIGVEGVMSIADAIRIATVDMVVIEPVIEQEAVDLYEIDRYVVDLTASETVLLDPTAPVDPDVVEPCPEFGLDLAAWETRLASADVFGWTNPFDAYALPANMAWFGQQLPTVTNNTIPMPDSSITIEPSDADLPPYFEGHPNCDVDGLMLFPYANSLPQLPR